jgi:hypothetical protein
MRVAELNGGISRRREGRRPFTLLSLVERPVGQSASRSRNPYLVLTGEEPKLGENRKVTVTM